jgi:uncharacterized membrane protein YoaK (UPF0700 family)
LVLGFVAGFVDIFGFLAWHGLLAAHVTGNLIFLAVEIARGEYDLLMKLLALPLFAVFVMLSAWWIEVAKSRDRDPLQAALLVQAGLIGACLLVGLALPPARGPDDVGAIIPGSVALFAMALQNTTMRMILNNLPPTTVMTGNITHVVSETTRWSLRPKSEEALLARRGKLIAVTLGSFTTGAIAGGILQVHIGYPGLMLPITTLVALLPLARAGRYREI